VQTLRTRNTDLATKIEQLEAQEETFKSLLVTMYQTRAPSASSIEGIDLPDWVPKDTGKPFELIQEALVKFEEINKELRAKCIELQDRDTSRTDELMSLKASEASGATIDEVMEDVGDREAAALRADNARLKEQLELERENFKDARKERSRWVKKYAKLETQFEKLEQQSIMLVNENTKLKMIAADKKSHQLTINAVRDEANKRVEDFRSREKTLSSRISQIQATADERVKRAEMEKVAAEKRAADCLAPRILALPLWNRASSYKLSSRTRPTKQKPAPRSPTARRQKPKE
jgi:hypothetical protein